MERRLRILHWGQYLINKYTALWAGWQGGRPEWRAHNPREIVSDFLHHIDTYKFMGLHGIHPRVLSELMKVITLLLSRTTCKEFVAWGLVSSPTWQEVGQEEMASIYTREGLGWILGDIFFTEGLSSIGKGCPGKWWNHHPWRYLKCGKWGHGLEGDLAMLPGNGWTQWP